MTELLSEVERYREVVKASREVIYEYLYEGDIGYFYGNLRDDTNRGMQEPVVFTHLMEHQLDNGMIHPADVPKVRFFAEGKLTGPIEFRFHIKNERYSWLSVSGVIKYDGTMPVRLIGKIIDITMEKQAEQGLLEQAQKDKLTNFLTWSVGIRVLDAGIMNEEQLKNMTFMYMRITNIEQISQSVGPVFMDALISRIATTISRFSRNEDIKIRVGYSSFVVTLNEVKYEEADKFRNVILERLKHIDRGIGIGCSINASINFFHTLAELFDAMPFEEKFALNENQTKNSPFASYSDDILTFAFSLMERSKNIDSAIQLVLERIGMQFDVDTIFVLERDVSMSQIAMNCIYELNMQNMENRLLGKKVVIDSQDYEAVRQILGHDDSFVVSEKLANDLPDLVEENLLEAGMLFCAIRSENEIWGSINFLRTNAKAEWKQEEIDTLVELTSIIASYILKERADRASAAKSNFLSSMSHEIRTPMNAINGFSELILAEKNISPQTKKYAADIRQASNNLVTIVNEILDFSKIEQGKFEIVEDDFMMSSLLHDVTAMIGMRLLEKPIDFIVEVDDNIPNMFYGDVTRIRQIMINILNNSVKYTDKGEIVFRVSWEEPKAGEEKGLLKATIKDTGIGIKQEDLSKLFEAFKQVDTKRNKGITGSGLGLAVVRSLLELMGGQVYVDSVYGEGSVFSFEVPLKSIGTQRCEFVYGKEYHSNEKSFSIDFIAPKANVLIVDDNKVNLEVARGIIEKYGINVVTALSGNEAIEIFKKHPDLDMIFMDHMMPVMDGVETTDRIRKSGLPRSKDITIVALTANAIKGVEKQFKEAGMNDFLSKPIELKKLRLILDRWIPDGKKESVPEGYFNEKPEEEDKREDILRDTLEGIDIAVGMENCQGDVKAYIGLLEAFVEQNQFEMAEKQFNDGDIKAYRITVHAMKSSAKYIGANDLSDKSKHMEDLAKEEKVDEIAAEQEELSELFKPVYMSARKAIELCDAANSKNQNVISDSKLMEVFKKVAKQLDDFDYDAAIETVHEILDEKNNF